MDFLSRFFGHKDAASAPSDAVAFAAAAPVEAAAPSDEAQWVDVPPFIDLPAGEERSRAAVIAAAIAAGDNPNTKVDIRRVGRVNPEYRRVSLIAASIAAGDRPESALSCVRIQCRVASGEENHAS